MVSESFEENAQILEQNPPSAQEGDNASIPATPSGTPPDTPLEKLRAAMNAPHSLKNLQEWLQAVRRAAQPVRKENPDSSEANLALQQAAWAEELLEIQDKLLRAKKELEGVAEAKDLPIPYRVKTTAISLKGQATDQRYQSAFQDECQQLFARAERLEKDAEDTKLKLLERDRRLVDYITSLGQEQHESALEYLTKLEESGQRDVPSADGSLISIYDAIRLAREAYLKFTVGKAEKYYKNATDYLKKETDEGLDNANAECLQAEKQLVGHRFIEEQLQKEKIADDIDKLRKELDDLLSKRAETRKILDNALTGEPDQVLKELDQLKYSWNKDRIEEVRKQVVQKLQDIWTNNVKEAIRQANLACLERKYGDAPGEAKNILNACREKLTQLPLEQQRLVERQIGELDRAIEALLIERELWVDFQSYQKNIDGLVEQSKVDSTILDEIQVHLDRQYQNYQHLPHYGNYFTRELKRLYSKVLPIAGENAVLEQIMRLYQENPAHDQIPIVAQEARNRGLFSKSSDLVGTLESYLHLQAAHHSLVQARLLVEDHTEFVGDNRIWHNKLDGYLRTCQDQATYSGIAETDRKILEVRREEIIKIKNRLSRVYNKVRSIRAEGVSAICRELENEIEHESGNNQSESVLIVRVLNAWREDVRRQWRQTGIEYAKNQVLGNEHPKIEQLRQAGRTIKDLENAHALTEDGDELVARQVLYMLARREVEEILSSVYPAFDLGNVTDQQITELGKLVWQDQQWEDLLVQLDMLLGTRFAETQVSHNAYRLRMVALAHFGLAGERSQVIQKLSAELPGLRELESASSIYVALVLRHLEDKNEREQARKLVGELETHSQKQRLIADGLKKLISAHELHERAELDAAVTTLLSGQSDLVTQLPELKASLEREIMQTTQAWFTSWVNQKLERIRPIVQNIRNQRRCNIDQFFQLLDSVNQASKYSATNDARVTDAIKAIGEVANQIGNDLEQELENLITSDDDLETKTDNAKKYEAYFRIIQTGNNPHIFPMNTSPWDIVIDSCHQLFDDEEGLKTRWDNALKVIKEQRKAFRRLYELNEMGFGKWSWNTNNRSSPLKDLNEITQQLRTVRVKLGDYQPAELSSLERLIQNARRCLEELDPDFKDLIRAIDERYDLGTLGFVNVLETKVEQWQNEKFSDQEVAIALKEENFHVRLEPFFQYRNPFRSMVRVPGGEPGVWIESGAPEALCDFQSIRQLIKHRNGNAHAWKTWKERTMQNLEAIRGHFNRVEQHLRRSELGEAINYCRDINGFPPICGLLDPQRSEENRNLLPKTIASIFSDRIAVTTLEPPLTTNILNEFARPRRDELEIMEEHPLREQWESAWEAIQSAPRYKVILAWRDFLTLEIARCLLELGWSREHTPAEWSSHWNEAFNRKYTELEQVLNTLHVPRRTTLEARFSEALNNLENQRQKIETHINRYMHPKKGPRWDNNALDTLVEYIGPAEKIDKYAEFVHRAQAIYTTYSKSLSSGR